MKQTKAENSKASTLTRKETDAFILPFDIYILIKRYILEMN